MIVFAKIFSLIKESKALLIIAYAVLSLENNTLCQNLNHTLSRDKILSIYNSSEKKTDEQLKELLRLQQEMKIFHLETDSSYMLLLQKIGVLYFKQSSYNQAINSTNESIQIAKNFLRNALPLVQNYSNLYYYYNSDNQLKKNTKRLIVVLHTPLNAGRALI